MTSVITCGVATEARENIATEVATTSRYYELNLHLALW